MRPSLRPAWSAGNRDLEPRSTRGEEALAPVDRMLHVRLVRPKKLPRELEPHLALLSAGRPALTDRYDARFAGYVASYGHPETFLLHHVESFHDAEMQGATVLDFGCGFGLLGAIFAALGAKKVVGIDLDASMINRGRQLQADWLTPEVAERVELVQGDFLTGALDGRCFDVITAIESLSHVQSVRRTLDKMRTCIEPYGRILVSDGNNSLYPPGRRRRRKIWARYDAETARPARMEIIRACAPEFDDSTVLRLGHLTVGRTEAEIGAMVERYRETGVEPTPFMRRQMMHPKTQYHEEREINPFELMERFERAGFEAKLLHPHTNYPPSWKSPKRWAKSALRGAHPYSVAAFPNFRLLLRNVGNGLRAPPPQNR